MNKMELDELDEPRDPMNPVEPITSYRFISECFKRSVATLWIGVRVGYLLAAYAQFERKRIMEQLMGHKNTATMAGWVFEGRVHRVLASGGKFLCSSLSGNDDLQIDLLKNHTTETTTTSSLKDLRKML